MAVGASAPDAAARALGVGDSVLICGLTEAEGLSLNEQLGIVTKQANSKGRVEVSVAGRLFRMLPANAMRLAFGIGARVEARGVDPESGRALDGHMGTVVGYTLASDRYQVYFAQGGMARLRATSLSKAGAPALAQVTLVTPQDGPVAQDAKGAPAPAEQETGEAAASGELAAPAPAAEEPPQATSAEVAATAALPSKRARATTDEEPDVLVIAAEPETETKPPAKCGRKAVPSGQAAKPAEKPEAPTEQAANAGAELDANAEAEPKVEAKARPLAKKRGRPPKAAACGLAAEPAEKPEQGSAEAKTPAKRGPPPKVAAAAKQAAGDVAAEQAVKVSSPTSPSLQPKAAARSSADVNATPATKQKRVAEEKAQSPAAGEAPAAKQRRGWLAKAAAGDITSAARGGCGAGGPSRAAAETLEGSDAWKKARFRGMEGRLLNLASRDDVSKRGFSPDRLFEALLAAGGLVNKAKAALLEAAEA